VSGAPEERRSLTQLHKPDWQEGSQSPANYYGSFVRVRFASVRVYVRWAIGKDSGLVFGFLGFSLRATKPARHKTGLWSYLVEDGRRKEVDC